MHQLQAALKAKELYKRDKDYIISDGEVKIVDEFTGRVLEGRRWSEGLHQAVEAKEGVKIKEENQTLATITLQNYFRMYEKLAGMTGTAQTEASELAGTYNLQVVPIPTNRTMVRLDQQDLIYKTEDGKFERGRRGPRRAVGERPAGARRHRSRSRSPRSCHACSRSEGCPTRCSTRSSTRVRRTSSLRPAGSGAVTVATNMAGRGVDILLGGNPGGLGRPERSSPRASTPRARRAPRCSRASSRAVRGRVPTPRATRCASSAASTCSAPSATRAGASTTSCEAVRAVRETPGRAGSTSRSRTS